MTIDDTDAAWAAAVAADTEAMDRAQLDVVLRCVRVARSRLDGVEMRAVRRIRRLAETGRAECPESAISGVGAHTGRDARSVSERDELCDERPELEDALDAGSIAGSHLDAINTAARNLPDDVRAEFLTHTDDLLRRASAVSLDAFQRECRQLAKHLLACARAGSEVDELEAQRAASNVKRWVDRSTGMHHTHLELDPIRDAKLGAAINRELARLRAADANSGVPWPQMLVNATLNTVCGSTTVTGGPAGEAGSTGAIVDRVPEITVLVDHQRLLDEGSSSGVCETENGVALPVATVRRLCCDAEVLPVVLDGAGVALDAGRSKRTATPAQRRSLRAMHRGCAHPGCWVGFDACRIHHVRHWLEHRGPTDLDNLLPLCERHHHMVHEGGWSLTMTGERIATWTRPDGVVQHTGPTVDRTGRARDDRATSPTASTETEAQLTLV